MKEEFTAMRQSHEELKEEFHKLCEAQQNRDASYERHFDAIMNCVCSKVKITWPIRTEEVLEELEENMKDDPILKENLVRIYC